jgi:pterin-4a-carbinolamine dehydratase
MSDADVMRMVTKLRRELRAAKTNDDIWGLMERIKKLSRESNHHPEVLELRRVAKEKQDLFKKNLL